MAGRKKRRWIAPAGAVLAGTLLVSAWAFTRGGGAAAPIFQDLGYQILERHPHDPNAYTQGLYFEGGFLFEGTGLRGESSLRRVEIETGIVRDQVLLGPRFFGEGIAALDSRIFQLTWTSGLGFIYDRDTFRQIGQFNYPGEGWGLTTDGRHLIMSDGSSSLRFMDPESFSEVRRVEVRGASGPVTQLNELEFADGFVFANVWFSNHILKIDLDTGEVVGDIDLSALYREVRPRESDAVLNGIAHDEANDRFFVTGKLWPTLFEIRIEGH